MNLVGLVGRLTKDPELRYTTTGTAYVRGTIAVNRTFQNQQGEKEADFISFVAWRKQAENLANFMRKGSQIGITGRIQTGSYDGQDGKKVYTTDVVADAIQFLDPPANGGAGQGQPNQQYGGQPTQPQYGADQGQPNQQYGGQPTQPQYGAGQGQPQQQYGGQPTQPQYGADQGQPTQPQYGGQPTQPQYGAGQGQPQQQYGGQPTQPQYGADQGQPNQPQYGAGQPTQPQYGGGQPTQPQYGGGQPQQQFSKGPIEVSEDDLPF